MTVVVLQLTVEVPEGIIKEIHVYEDLQAAWSRVYHEQSLSDIYRKFVSYDFREYPILPELVGVLFPDHHE